MTLHDAWTALRHGGNLLAPAALDGLPESETPQWGLADRLGSLEVGKEADVVVWDGDPLELATFPTQVVIRGVEVPMDSRQTRLRDRYRTLPGDLPPAYRQP